MSAPQTLSCIALLALACLAPAAAAGSVPRALRSSGLAPAHAPDAAAAPTPESLARDLAAASVSQAEPALAPGPFASLPSPAAGPPAAAPPPPSPTWVTSYTNLTSFLNPGTAYAPPLSAAQRAAAAGLKDWRQGTGTVSAARDFQETGVQTLNCGIGYLNPHFTYYYAGVSATYYAAGQYCGMCLNVTCVDTVCPHAMLDYALFMLVDSCASCEGDDITISAPGLGNITDVDYNINPVMKLAWQPVACNSLITGGIRLWPSTQNNQYFIGINFSNLKELLTSVTLSGIAMAYQSYGYWTINTPGTPIPISAPYTLQLTAQTGETLSLNIPSIIPLDLGVNFS
ncbi:hypothetical protein ACKKBG_A00670 [Auxenochlorella protothecoides x Auxenochlorella symbiontica]